MEEYSNFITPSDYVDDDTKATVLIVDADWLEIETVALWCKTADRFYNIYVYSDVMQDEEWLSNVINRAAHIIVNPADSAISHIKNQLIKAPNVWYYGDKKFLANPRHMSNPVEFFINNNG